jgi:AraC-like DNA-binding protein
VEGEHFPLQKGDLFFFPAGMRHCSLFLPGRKFDCYVLEFESQMFSTTHPADREILDVVNKMSLFRGRVPLSDQVGSTIKRILSELHREFREKNAAYLAVLKMMAMELFVTIARDAEFSSQGIPLKRSPSHEELVREVIHYLNASYMNSISIDSVLEFCPLSRSHFHMVFKEHTGRTLLEYLTDLRVEKAKERLAATDAPVAEIAMQTGFKTSSYFGQVFRLCTGISPGDYRRCFPSPPSEL